MAAAVPTYHSLTHTHTHTIPPLRYAISVWSSYPSRRPWARLQWRCRCGRLLQGRINKAIWRGVIAACVSTPSGGGGLRARALRYCHVDLPALWPAAVAASSGWLSPIRSPSCSGARVGPWSSDKAHLLATTVYHHGVQKRKVVDSRDHNKNDQLVNVGFLHMVIQHPPGSDTVGGLADATAHNF